jgi:hypothetical protein
VWINLRSSSRQAEAYVGRELNRTVSKTMATATFVEVLLAIFLPPVGVFLRYDCGVSGQALSVT